CRSAIGLRAWEQRSKLPPIQPQSSRFRHQRKKRLHRLLRTKMPGQFCRTSAALLLFTGGPIVGVYALGWAGLRFNSTPSVPTGLYWISSDPATEYVEFCPPEPFGTLSAERGYRARSTGPCSDGAIPLLKPIVARSGDIVEVSPRGISVNGIPVPNTAPK